MKKRKQQKNISTLLVVLSVTIITIYLLYHLYTNSENSVIIYFPKNITIIPDEENYTSNQQINISSTLINLYSKYELLKPLNKIGLRVTTQLENSKIFMKIGNDMQAPYFTEKTKRLKNTYYEYYFILPKENKTIELFLSGTTPNITERILFFGLVEIFYYPFGKKEQYLKSEWRNVVK